MSDTPPMTGLQTGFAAGTRVATPDDFVAVETLRPNDRIVTRQGVRRLRDVRERVADQITAITIRASALGHLRPESDTTVAPDQLVLLRDWRAGVLFGSASAQVPAHRLVDGDHVSIAAAGGLRMFDLVFDAPQTIYAEGVEMQTTITTAATANP